MAEKIFDVIKIFLEKHFLPTVASVALALISMVFIPDEWFVVEKLGINWFRVLLFCVAFLIVEGILKLYYFILDKIDESKKKKEQEQQQQLKAKQQQEYELEQMESDLEELWKVVDALSIDDRKYIEKFLKTGNAPIRLKDEFDLTMNSQLFNSKMVNKTLVKEAVDDMYHWEPAEYQYILVKDIYQLLKISKEQYGRISHFE